MVAENVFVVVFASWPSEPLRVCSPLAKNVTVLGIESRYMLMMRIMQIPNSLFMMYSINKIKIE